MIIADLNIYPYNLILAIYGITKSFPTDEQFGLVSQMRRAAVSICSKVPSGWRILSIS